MLKVTRYSANYDGTEKKYCAVYDDKYITFDAVKGAIMSGRVEENPRIIQMTEAQFNEVLTPTLNKIDKMNKLISSMYIQIKNTQESAKYALDEADISILEINN